ncbi:MAG: hypothetical protein HY673_09470 [Chloroflexi bacterium]|nr:hypothetical protein [Chloroflexota bacterium]
MTAIPASSAMPDARQIADALSCGKPGCACNPRPGHNGQRLTHCPAHDDENPSLSLTDSNDGHILLKCFAGCTQDAVIEALKERGLWNGHRPATERRIVATYDYLDEQCNLLFQVVRYEPKTFRQRHKNGSGEWTWNMEGVRRVLYHLEMLSGAEELYLVEGEKDADNLLAANVIATTSPGGANAWRDEYAQYLIGKTVIIIPDRDPPGMAYARQVANSLAGKAKEIRVILLPGDGVKDISDWLAAGGKVDNLVALEQSVEVLRPSPVDKPPCPAPAAHPQNTGVVFPEEAWVSLFKDYRDLVGPTTEAADAFHYATFCQVLGCTLGRDAHLYHAGKLFPNFYVCLIGKTGLTRKDTCWARARGLLDELHSYSTEGEENPPFRTVKGIRSYEGLLDELAGERKVRLIQVSELLSLLAKAKQESLGNIIPQLTELYDNPDRVNPPVHQKMVDCKEPFLSIMAGTTQAWLQKSLTEGEIYGGFANRWMYFVGLPKGPKANPPKMVEDNRRKLIDAINEVRRWAKALPNGGELDISDETQALFAEYYGPYYKRCQVEGVVPTLAVRVQDFIWKLALLYAAMEQSPKIKESHMTPAIAVGKYLEASVAEIFGAFTDSGSKQSESKVLTYLKNQGGPVAYRDVYYNLHLSARELELATGPLVKLGLIKPVSVDGKKGKRTVRGLEAV